MLLFLYLKSLSCKIPTSMFLVLLSFKNSPLNSPSQKRVPSVSLYLWLSIWHLQFWRHAWRRGKKVSVAFVAVTWRPIRWHLAIRHWTQDIGIHIERLLALIELKWSLMRLNGGEWRATLTGAHCACASWINYVKCVVKEIVEAAGQWPPYNSPINLKVPSMIS